MSEVENLSAAPKEKAIVLMYNQMNGVKKGKKPKWTLSYGHYQMTSNNQKATQSSKDYLVAIINPKTN